MSFDPFDPLDRSHVRAIAGQPCPTALLSEQRPPFGEASEQLRPLLATAALLEVDDIDGWRAVRATAQRVLDVAVTSGAVPLHLAVGPADPPARVARTLAAAWRHVSRAR